MLKVAICGGGHLAHALAATAAAVSDCEVWVLTRRPEIWDGRCRASCRGVVVEGPVKASQDPVEAVAGAKLIILAAPAFAHAEILSRAAPCVAPDAWVGALPAVGGFDILARSLLPQHQRIFGSLRAPYNARVIRPGAEAGVTGVVSRLELSVTAPDALAGIKALLEYVLGIPVVLVTPFLVTTLCPGSTIFHPARLFELVQRPPSAGETFYGGWGAVASRAYLRLDAELTELRSALGLQSAGWSAAEHYGVYDEDQLTRRIRGLAGLPSISCPLLPSGEFDAEHRFLSEDLPYGLAVVRRIQDLLGHQGSAIQELEETIVKHVPSGSRVDVALPSRLKSLSLSDWLGRDAD